MGPMADSERAAFSLDFIRVAVAVLIFIHGATRASIGGVEPFGEWLGSQGFPFGLQQAWAVTIYELTSPLLILARRFVTIACLGHIFILSVGLVLVHAPNGWFVVGAGRNGVEYSVLLIAALIAIAWTHWPAWMRLSRS
jgi:putative oxidoreductase